MISPEGCASILFKSASRAKEAAEAMKITSKDLIDHKLVDEIVPEPLGGAHRDVPGMMAAVKSRLVSNIDRLRRTRATSV